MGEGIGDGAGEEVEGEVEVAEGGAGGDGCGGEGGVEVIVGKREGGERGEAAEGGRELAGELGVWEVDGGDGAGEGVTGDAGPVARGGIAAVPVGEGIGRVGELELGAEEEETLLVERKSGRRNREEQNKEEQLFNHACSVFYYSVSLSQSLGFI